MPSNAINLFRRFLCLLLTAAIFLPTVKRLNHALYEHTEVVCVNADALHFHEVEFDCEFQKFYPAPQFACDLPQEQTNLQSQPRKIEWSYYAYLSDFSKLHFSLRAPPFTSFVLA